MPNLTQKEKIKFLEYLVEELEAGNFDSWARNFIQDLNGPIPINPELMDLNGPVSLVVDFLENYIELENHA